MTFKVFISSSMKDMRIVEELKETLERYGIEPILPTDIIIEKVMERHLFGDGIERRETRTMPWIANIQQQIHKSDCILVIVGMGGRRSEFVDLEIGMATALNKLVVPIVEEGAKIPRTLVDRQFILIDRNQPKLSYERAAQYLNRLKIEKERRNAIGGLLLLGLGLLLLNALSGD